MSQLSIMVDTSSDASSRPTQFHSYSSPQDNSSAPSSASLHSPMTPGGGHLPFPGPTSRPSSGVGAPHGHPYSLPPASSPRIAPYNQPQYYGMPSPQGVQLPSYQGVVHPHGHFIGSPDAMGIQIPMVPQGQKRPYRQRRKDPSCDACRERKVKCDATDTSSCTECTSRSVRCQFTKDTNRRMTSLKHNQDLIKELARTKSELEQARIEVEGGKTAPLSRNASATHLPGLDSQNVPGHGMPHLPGPEEIRLLQDPKQYAQEQHPSLDQPPTKKRRLAGHEDFSKVGLNMQRYGRGIFKAPYPSRQTASSMSFSLDVPALPTKEVADGLFRQYHYTLHPTIPVLYWHEFQQQYDRVYEQGSLQNVPRIWIGLLFAVFAIGTLHRDTKEGQNYHHISRSQIDTWADDLTLDHARAALLTSIFLVETNLKSAGWTWLGIASRIAFDIGLHSEAGTWPAIEEEMRRRVWWCIYSCDCLLCLEMGRPSMINEEDCNVGMPSPVDDQYILPGSQWMTPTPEESTSPLLPMIQVVGGISRLLRVLKVPSLAAATLQAYESHFNKCMDGFQVQQQMHLGEYLDPVELPAIIYLQNARLMLHRNNLTPLCVADARSRAIDSCASVARDTAKFLHCCMQPPAGSQSSITAQNDTWEKRLVSAASALFCTHIWRCTLFLCSRLDFHDALVCARASATLGNARPVNTACGRYLAFYLKQLIRRLDQGISSFDTDEEMIAYASGDLQGNFESSWIWQEVIVGDAPLWKGHSLQDNIQSVNSTTPEKKEDPQEDEEEEDRGQWNGWERVLQTLERLHREHEKEKEPEMPAPLPPSLSTTTTITAMTTTTTIYARPSSGPRKISPPDPERLRTMAQSPEAQAARDKMSIKDLI